MHIIGPEPSASTDDTVHTIDVWYAETRRRWIVQRLNGHGDAVGAIHTCRSRTEATACVADWMRRHPETHLTTPKARGGRSRTTGRA